MGRGCSLQPVLGWRLAAEPELPVHGIVFDVNYCLASNPSILRFFASYLPVMMKSLNIERRCFES